MKSILLSIKPEWVAKILNGEKTIEIRKLFPKDYVGWVYLYCSKGNRKNWHLIEVVDDVYSKTEYEYDYYIGSEGYLDWCLEGKVVARFWCDKVEEIVSLFSYAYEDYKYVTDSLWFPQLIKKSCLNEEQFNSYLGDKNGFAIHVSKLEIFDRPRELNEFKKAGYLDKIKPIKVNPNLKDAYKSFEPIYNKQIEKDYALTKAPQNYCYIEGE